MATDHQASGFCRYPGCEKRFKRSYEVIRHLANIHAKREYTVLHPKPYLDIRDTTLFDSSDERLLEVGATTRRCIPRLRKMLKDLNDEFGHLRQAYATRQLLGWQDGTDGGEVSPVVSWTSDREDSQSPSSSASTSSGEDNASSPGLNYQNSNSIPSQNSAGASFNHFTALFTSSPLHWQFPGSFPSTTVTDDLQLRPDRHTPRAHKVINGFKWPLSDLNQCLTQYAIGAWCPGDQFVGTAPWGMNSPRVAAMDSSAVAAGSISSSTYPHMKSGNWGSPEGEPMFTDITLYPHIFPEIQSHRGHQFPADKDYYGLVEPTVSQASPLSNDWNFSVYH